MYLVRGRPHRALSGVVGSYADFAERTDGPRETGEPPGRGVVVIVDLDAGWTVEGERFGSFAGGLYARPVRVRHEGSSRGVQFDLEPPAVRALLGVPAGELAERTVALADLLGTRAERLAERLHAAPDPGARFAVLDEVLVDALAEARTPPRPWAPSGSPSTRTTRAARGLPPGAGLVSYVLRGGVACLVTMGLVAGWMGVDVGGRRKAFDVALVEGHSLTGLVPRQSVDDVVGWVASVKPSVVAIDSPRSTAPPGRTHRPEEKVVRADVCGIRWTPPSTKLDRNPYYEWIVEGLRLYDALAPERIEVVECFPTASWTRWHGPRHGRRRAAWTREGLAALGLEGVPSRTNQDMRDAIAAALTARDYDNGRIEAFGHIIVPRPA